MVRYFFWPSGPVTHFITLERPRSAVMNYDLLFSYLQRTLCASQPPGTELRPRHADYRINVIPADFAAETSKVIVLPQPALAAPRSIKQSAKSAEPER